MAGIKFPSKPPKRRPAKQIGTKPMLPNRAALHQLTRGNPAQMSGAAFADATPSGLAGMDQGYGALTDMGTPPDDTGDGG